MKYNFPLKKRNKELPQLVRRDEQKVEVKALASLQLKLCQIKGEKCFIDVLLGKS